MPTATGIRDLKAEISTDSRSTYRPILGRHVVRVNRPSVDTIGRYVGRHSADTSADVSRATAGDVSVDCRWYLYIAYAMA